MNIYSPVSQLKHKIFEQYQISVFIKRDDLIHPIISGNKWRMLKYNLKHAQEHSYQGILSFGGAFSNHIHALAYASQQAGLKSIGVIRGEPSYQSNPTLQQVQKWGMALHFVSKEEYRKRHQNDYLVQLQEQFPNFYIVPEGGSNLLALPGVGEVIEELNQELSFDHIMLPVGSGGTISGLIAADKGEHNILGVGVLKQSEYLIEQISHWLNKTNCNYTNWQLLTEFHGGGYGKFNSEAAAKVCQLSHHFQVPFEPIYSGKMLLALFSLIEQGYFAPKSRIVLIHTGGLQGLAGLTHRGKVKADQWLFPTGLQAL